MIFTAYEEEQIIARSGLLVSMSSDALNTVRANYKESHRQYHDWNHALSVISWVNHVYDVGIRWPSTAAAFAALYHDVVYDEAGSPLNEVRSAHVMRSHVGYDLYPAVLETVDRLIMLTAKHGKLESDDVTPEEALFLDCDMAGFAEARWEQMLWNERNIQAEYLAHFDIKQALAGRKAFLTSMRAKRSVFLSEYFRDRFESQAQRNIERLIEGL